MTGPRRGRQEWVGLHWADDFWGQLAATDTGFEYVQRGIRLLVQQTRQHFDIDPEVDHRVQVLSYTIQVLVEIRDASDQILRDVVEQARLDATPYSWTVIGDALGVGRTAAQKRFGHGLSDERREELKIELYQAIQKLKTEILRMKLNPPVVEWKKRRLEEYVETLRKRYGVIEAEQLEFEL